MYAHFSPFQIGAQLQHKYCQPFLQLFIYFALMPIQQYQLTLIHMQQERKKPEKAERIKLHKDFGFLLEKQPLLINSKTMKYILEEGKGEIVSELKENPFDAIFSYVKYDYEGKTVEKVAIGKITSDKPETLRDQILSMKIKEKAWFNVCDQIVHSTVQFVENGIITEDTEEFFEEQKQSDPSNRTGFHYQIYLDRIEFRNSDKIEIKRKINEHNRQKGRALFQEKKYFQAAKVYKFIINISQNFARNNPYSPQEKGQLESMNLNAKLNYIRCYFKIQENWVQKDLADFAKQVLDNLLLRKPEDYTTHFYHAKWLLRQRVLDSALEAAKRSNALKRNAATDQLISEIMNEKKNKGKIKVAVNV